MSNGSNDDERWDGTSVPSWLPPPPPLAPADPSSFAALQRRLDAEAAPRGRLRALSTRSRRLLAIAGVLVVAAVVATTSPRVDLGPALSIAFWFQLAALFGVAILVAGLAYRPLHRPPAAGSSIALVTSAAVIAIVAGAVAPSGPADAGVGHRTLGCFLWGSGFAAAALAWIRALSRGRGALWQPTWSTALLAVLTGQVALHLHCAATSLPHLWAGHAAILVPYALLAAWTRVHASDG